MVFGHFLRFINQFLSVLKTGNVLVFKSLLVTYSAMAPSASMALAATAEAAAALPREACTVREDLRLEKEGKTSGDARREMKTRLREWIPRREKPQHGL
jgi:hypothetical protein